MNAIRDIYSSNYVLDIFKGQGVMHYSIEGYGVIQAVPQQKTKVKTVSVKFTGQPEPTTVSVSDLFPACMSQKELHALRLKHGMIEAEDENVPEG